MHFRVREKFLTWIVEIGSKNSRVNSASITIQDQSFMPKLLNSCSGNSSKVELLLLLQAQRIGGAV